MAKYIAIAATKNKTIEGWGGTSEFTDEAISQLTESAAGKPILMDFDENKRIGKVVSAKNDNGKLVLNIDMDVNYTFDVADRIVPSFIVGQDFWDVAEKRAHRTIKKAESIAYGLTRTSIDQGLPEIEKNDN